MADGESRALKLSLIVALAVWGLATVLALHETDWRPFIDSAVYILAAKSLAAGQGYSYLGEPFFQHPPGLSVLLRPFVAEPIDFSTLNRLVQLCAAGGFAVMALCFSRLHGVTIGVLVALLFGLNPLAVGAQNAVLTEYPFLLLFFAGAWLLMPRPVDERGRATEPVPWGRGLLGAVLLAASLYFRTVALIALPALVLADLLRKGARRWQGAALAALVLLLYLPWLLHAGATAGRAPPATQFKAFDYTTAMFHADAQDPGSPRVGLEVWGERLADNAGQLVEAVGRHLLGGLQGLPATLMSLLLAVALVFTWLDRRSMLDWYAMGSVAVLLTMYLFADRFLLPLLPLLISALLHAARRLGAAVLPGPGAKGMPLTAVSLLLLGTSLASLPAALSFDQERVVNRSMDRQLAEWLVENTAPDARVLADRAPVLSVLSGRTVYTYRHLPGGAAATWPEVDWALLGPGKVDIEQRLRRVALSVQTLQVPLPDKVRSLRVYQLAEPGPGR